MWREFWDNGNISSETNYKNGKLNGLYASFYKNGNIKTSGEFKGGIQNGMCTWYFSDGTKKAEGSLIEGNGTVMHYNENGVMISESVYKNNEVVEKKLK